MPEFIKSLYKLFSLYGLCGILYNKDDQLFTQGGAPFYDDLPVGVLYCRSRGAEFQRRCRAAVHHPARHHLPDQCAGKGDRAAPVRAHHPPHQADRCRAVLLSGHGADDQLWAAGAEEGAGYSGRRPLPPDRRAAAAVRLQHLFQHSGRVPAPVSQRLRGRCAAGQPTPAGTAALRAAGYRLLLRHRAFPRPGHLLYAPVRPGLPCADEPQLSPCRPAGAASGRPEGAERGVLRRIRQLSVRLSGAVAGAAGAGGSGLQQDHPQL